MGLYDRDYVRYRRSPLGTAGPQSAVITLIILNVVIYIADGFSGQLLSNLGAARVETLWTPWTWWRFVTYGFLHSPTPQHVFFNMLTLFFFGRDMENLLGRNEFLRLYFAMIILGGIVWAVANRMTGVVGGTYLVGASGAVIGMFFLFCLNFPNRIVLLFFVLPVPAWVAGLLLVVPDFLYALKNADTNIAYSVHITGVLIALAYYQSGFRLGRLFDFGGFFDRWRSRRPSLKVRRFEEDEDAEDAQARREAEELEELRREVDRLLDKIRDHGEESLTRKERRFLENASRRLREHMKRR
ncbi:rhomboid family intramembrane serine protease [Thermostilla marina]